MARAEAGAVDGSFGIIVLAAGSSSRMGTHKLLLPLGGKPLAAYAVEAALASAAQPRVVVLGRAADDVRAALPTGHYQTVVNPDYVTGMAGSLRVGLHALREMSRDMIAGVLIALADQPLAGVDLFDALLIAAAHAPEAIVAASYGGRRGTPVVFPEALFTELEQVEGDEGGRGVIARHLDLLRLVEWPDPLAALDVDRPQDYARVVSLLGGNTPRAASAD